MADDRIRELEIMIRLIDIDIFWPEGVRGDKNKPTEGEGGASGSSSSSGSTGSTG